MYWVQPAKHLYPESQIPVCLCDNKANVVKYLLLGNLSERYMDILLV